MIGCLLALALAGEPMVRLDRVDLLSETSTWMHDELPRAGASPRFAAVRWIEQVMPVIALPPEGLQLGISLRTQSIRFEHGIGGPWVANHGMQLGAGLPNGLVWGAAWREGALRVGGSLSLVSSATWARPAWTHWRLLPTIGIGIGPNPRPTAPWM